MFRLTTRKTLIIPHSLAVFSAVLLIWSTQVETSAVEARLQEPQQLVESCTDNDQIIVSVTGKPATNNALAILHLL